MGLSMVKELLDGLMENSISVNIIRIKDKDMEYLFRLMEYNIKEYGMRMF